MPINDYSHLVFCTSDISPNPAWVCVLLCLELSLKCPFFRLCPCSWPISSFCCFCILQKCNLVFLCKVLCFLPFLKYLTRVCFHLLLIWDLQISVQLKSLTSSKILRIATISHSHFHLACLNLFPDPLLFLSSLSPLRTRAQEFTALILHADILRVIFNFSEPLIHCKLMLQALFHKYFTNHKSSLFLETQPPLPQWRPFSLLTVIFQQFPNKISSLLSLS